MRALSESVWWQQPCFVEGDIIRLKHHGTGLRRQHIANVRKELTDDCYIVAQVITLVNRSVHYACDALGRLPYQQFTHPQQVILQRLDGACIPTPYSGSLFLHAAPIAHAKRAVA